MKKLISFITALLLIILTGCSMSHTVTTTTKLKTITVQNNPSLNSKADYYRLFSKDIKHDITIEITTTEFNKLLKDMKDYYSRYSDYKTDTYFKANMIYTDLYGSIKIENVGFRTKGNTSRVLPMNDDGSYNLSHYKIKFNETFDFKNYSSEYKTLADRKVFDLDEINLKFNRNWDASYISELFSYELFNKAGVNSPKATLASFTLKVGNKETLMGVYTVLEPIDKEFFDKRYEDDETTGNLYKCLWQGYGPATLIPIRDSKAIGIKNTDFNYRPSYDLKTNKTNPNFTDLNTFITNLNKFNGVQFENFIEKSFEVDKFLRLMAMGALVGSPDDYRGLGNNYYLYDNPKTNKFEMIPYDYDHSLGQGWDGSPAFSNFTIGANIYNWPSNNKKWNEPSGDSSHPLADKILNIPKYQVKYEAYLNEFIKSKEIFNYDNFIDQYNIYKSLYNNDAKNSFQKLGFSERNSRSYFENKIKDIENQLKYYQNNPSKRGVN